MSTFDALANVQSKARVPENLCLKTSLDHFEFTKYFESNILNNPKKRGVYSLQQGKLP